jgi:hypothetical protein
MFGMYVLYQSTRHHLLLSVRYVCTVPVYTAPSLKKDIFNLLSATESDEISGDIWSTLKHGLRILLIHTFPCPCVRRKYGITQMVLVFLPKK